MLTNVTGLFFPPTICRLPDESYTSDDNLLLSLSLCVRTTNVFLSGGNVTQKTIVETDQMSLQTAVRKKIICYR